MATRIFKGKGVTVTRIFKGKGGTAARIMRNGCKDNEVRLQDIEVRLQGY